MAKEPEKLVVNCDGSQQIIQNLYGVDAESQSQSVIVLGQKGPCLCMSHIRGSVPTSRLVSMVHLYPSGLKL